MTRTLGLIGVPSSAGAHAPGQEKAPLSKVWSAPLQERNDNPLFVCPLLRSFRQCLMLNGLQLSVTLAAGIHPLFPR
jgi:hypothetical protein